VNGTTLEQPEVAAYLAAVRRALADVPADERDELLADVEASLLESGGEALTRPPETFASELREAAGLDPVSRTPGRLDALLERLRRAAGDTRLRELAPIWWIVRAYVAVAVLAMLSGSGWPLGAGGFGAGTLSGTSGPGSVLLLLAGCVASVWLGLRSRDWSRTPARMLAVANVALALALVPVALDSIDKLDSHSSSYETIEVPTPGLALDGVQVTNLYPYSRDGELLQDVLLYTDDGRPLDLLTSPDDVDRRVLETADGLQLFNSFPIRYFEPGTGVVTRPELAPPITVPSVTTPKLESPK
jgi:hypothetical protein